jgi:hypothetical protein
MRELKESLQGHDDEESYVDDLDDERPAAKPVP